MTSFDKNVTSDGYYYYHDAINGRMIKCRLIGVMGMKDGEASDVDATVMINWNGYYNGIDKRNIFFQSYRIYSIILKNGGKQ